MEMNEKPCTVSRCEIPIRVRYCEVDRMGAVHHSRYAVYFEMGRTELLRENGYDYKTLEDRGILLVIAQLNCRYKAPARYDDELVLTTKVGKTDRIRLEHLYELKRPCDNRIIAQASSVLVHIDAKGRLWPLPAFLTTCQ